MSELKGVLFKQGVGALGRGFKKRYFRQQGKSLLYFRGESDKQELGRIELDEAFKVRATDVKEGKFGFQIDTPKRIWALLADNQESLNYWVDGINNFISAKESKAEYRQSVRYETMENRIRDLEGHDATLKRALEIAASRLNTTVEQLLQEAEAEISKPSSSSSSSSSSSAAAAAPAVAEASSSPSVVETPVAAAAAAVSAPEAAGETKKTESDEEKKDDQSKMKRFRARVLYDYTAQQDYEMTIRVGEVITVLSKHGNGWWLGASAESKQGYFPGSYVEPIEE
eukprot:CAMPEP_0184332654 /NCGR_PEP_ID=MMETSP1089-20130417/1823_1 /TAXON_ID=38269 ORGANISM="Gloeochaete wittrockiana, Strain SAG46.84" /NCGR_SAMPLE_ID=MMETSP1089 /ASSEMBLY_ACC=CAM_ASM_000445 /LENGTH=283 /DNA_ID=CAMNT_0026656149 /DNA_START=92 /DNA_END=943 /DNA_ORIENTATION=+